MSYAFFTLSLSYALYFVLVQWINKITFNQIERLHKKTNIQRGW